MNLDVFSAEVLSYLNNATGKTGLTVKLMAMIHSDTMYGETLVHKIDLFHQYAFILSDQCHKQEQFYYRRQDDTVQKVFDEGKDTCIIFFFGTVISHSYCWELQLDLFIVCI